MRRWKTAIKTLVSGFSLPVASFSYPARKKSLILRLALKRLKMAKILIKIKIEGNSNALAFVERTQPYLSKTLKEIRQDIVSEVGELLPRNFKFVRTGIPVSAIQEEKLHLQKCMGEKESGKVLSLSIQVHNSLEKKDFREISTQSSRKKCRGGQSVARLCGPLLLLPSCCGKSRMPPLHYCMYRSTISSLTNTGNGLPGW